jgi:hypothetical protein
MGHWCIIFFTLQTSLATCTASLAVSSSFKKHLIATAAPVARQLALYTVALLQGAGSRLSEVAFDV